ncbi:MAG: hypothetical protein ABL933_18675 [Methyloglobulus sp.]|nr:hypothetical protein [Methyloglobulus sp.]
MTLLLESVNIFDSAVESKLVKELRKSFPDEQYLHLLEKGLKFYQTNFWYPLDRKPENIFESVIQDLKTLANPSPAVIGVEWWFSVTFTNTTPQWLLGCHFDRNNLNEREFEKISHPKTASVLFLNKVSYGDLVVTDQVLTKNGISRSEPTDMKFVSPKTNRFVTFPGNLYHGVIGRMWRPRKETQLRIAMAVNWWEHKPMNSYMQDSRESASVFKLTSR